MIWIAGAGSILLLALLAVGLVDLIRNRHRIETRYVVIWSIVLVLVPVVGLVSYLLWRIAQSEAIADAIDFQDEHSSETGPYPSIGH